MTRTLVALLACGSLALGGQDDSTRSITAQKFLKARPTATAKPVTNPTYRRVGRPTTKIAPAAETRDLGVTIWRLRPARPGDAVRLLVQERETFELTPERIPAGTPLASGDRVRITIESPNDGYLYVLDREQYADGTEGQPHLIFPTTRTHEGDNRVSGGRLIEIPAQDDRPPFFTMRPGRPDQTGERLTIVVSRDPIDGITLSSEAAPVPATLAASMEAKGGGAVERLELVGGAGQSWSRAEQQAGADATRLLRQDDPLPQTVFRVVVTEREALVVDLTLPQSKRKMR